MIDGEYECPAATLNSYFWCFYLFFMPLAVARLHREHRNFPHPQPIAGSIENYHRANSHVGIATLY
jgi:hypothetical protein